MIIYPAIDLYNGNCVRLYKGDYNQTTIYSDDPILIAQKFQQQGATHLHIVDLNAAKDPSQNQYELIKNIVKNTKLTIQIGGGIRTRNQIQQLFDAGITRVIIGSKAIHDMEEVKKWFIEFGNERLVLALDFHIDNENKYYIAFQGWQQKSEITIEELMMQYVDINVKHILCTDINRDGTLTGINQYCYKGLMKLFPHIAWQASGGISNLDDIDQLKQQKIAALIIGKALYENKFTLAQAIRKGNAAC